MTRTIFRQKDFIFAYKRGPYAAPTQAAEPTASGSRRLQAEPPNKRQRTAETATGEDACPPSPGRICSIATYTRFSKLQPNSVVSLRYPLSFFFGLNGVV